MTLSKSVVLLGLQLALCAAIIQPHAGAADKPSPKGHTFGAQVRRKPMLGLKTRILGGAEAVMSTTRMAKEESAVEPPSEAPAAPVDVVQPHSMSIPEVLAYFGANPKAGLSSSDVDARREQYGENVLVQAPGASIWELIQEQFQDRLVQILLGVAVFSGIMSIMENDKHAWLEPMVILLILVLNAFVGIWQELSAQDSLDALKKLQPTTCNVLRDGKIVDDAPASELVPGDVINLVVGDKVPADARVIELLTTTMSCDEGSLTGESTTVPKTPDTVEGPVPIQGKKNIVFGGTMITGGKAKAVVTSTGMSTEIGRIQAGVSEAKLDQEKTPLGQKLDEFGDQLSKIIGGICIAVWAISAPKFWAPVFATPLMGALYYAKVAVALGVAAIPEGLPAVITLCLSLGTRRMAQRNVIVRRLPSVETLGCTSVICTDKTGTLTTNQMTAVSLIHFKNSIAGGEEESMTEHKIQATSYDPRGDVPGVDLSAGGRNEGLKDLAACISLCNDAQLVLRPDGIFDRIGEPTEAALKTLVEKLGAPGVAKPDSPADACNCANKYWYTKFDRLATLEFNRDRKSMSVIVQPKDGGLNRLFVKGAPEMLLERCKSVMLPSGQVVPLTSSLKEEIRLKNKELAMRPLRCLAVAVKEGKQMGALGKWDGEMEDGNLPAPLRDPSKFADVESDLTLIGVVGIKDPARPEVKPAIESCKQAGIRVIVITGDSKDTATAIARDIGIFEEFEDVTNKAFIGADFFKLTEAEQKRILGQGENIVFCRTEPRDKQRLVKMLSDMGEVAAMTGDGVNDAPALQQAAIGVAMGVTGTEVAKEASDMILADDNFATIVTAVEEGRCIYDNMQSFICFLISCNIGEIATIFLSTLIGLPEPLTPLHLLWVNLVTDGPPATALGFNPPDPDAMTRKPRGRDTPILTKWLLTRYVLTGLYVGIATIGAFATWYMRHGVGLFQLARWGSCSTWDNFKLTNLEEPIASLIAENPCDIFTPARRHAQSVALATLVTMEMLKAASAISVDNSLLRMPPWRNKWLLLGIAAPSALHLTVTYVPALGGMLGLTPLTAADWISVLIFALPVVLVEELLKMKGRELKALEAAEEEEAT